MLKSDLKLPLSGSNRNPVLHGVANGLAKLFPPVERPEPSTREAARPESARPARD